ncbi:hypothetical protein [Lachnoclostridium phytofermentans]|uniref:Uncharacterized protein n=1 Tax=Lachnoclostridium phytofermentans (strain ATCC 700394 / DSM 18823 / ISDg) TaxID=357809 RepID=A9KKL2_LACP7|nr:hypothetical protein [Lachnoclostridium phytofermentans]ABX41183.1 hypothetical protein Cphy_0796 [Lachnoclostridium phytofermentans ISDg]
MAKGLYIGDPSIGLAKKIKKLYIGDPSTGAARNVKKVYIGDQSTGVARLAWTAGTRGMFLVSFNTGGIFKTNNIENLSSYVKVDLPNTYAYTMMEGGDYYIIDWQTSTSCGIYYSTDCVEWVSKDLTNLMYYKQWRKYYWDGEFYFTDYKNSKLVYQKTKDFVNFTQIDMTAVPYHDCTIVNDTTFVKITTTITGTYPYDYRNYYPTITYDKGKTWTIGTFLGSHYNSGSYYASGSSIKYYPEWGGLHANKTYVSYASSDGQFKCTGENLSATYNVNNISEKKSLLEWSSSNYVGSNYNVSLGDLPFRYQETLTASTYGESWVSNVQLLQLYPYSNTPQYSLGDAVSFSYPAEQNNWLSIKCLDKNCYYLLTTKKTGNNLYAFNVYKVPIGYTASYRFSALINDTTATKNYLTQIVYKPLT